MPFRLALQSLTEWESLLVQHVLGHPDVHVVSDPGDGAVLVTRSALGKISLWHRETPRPEADEIAGWLQVPPQVLDMVAEEAFAASVREDVELRELTGVLQEWESSGELDRRLRQLLDWVERVETVLVFIGRDVFSKSDAGSNTLTRDGLLADLMATPVSSWRPADRLFVAAGHVLFTTGRAVRFEEFNGRQLTARRLRDFLVDRYVNYRVAVGKEPAGVHGTPLFELAGRVRDALTEVDRSPFMRYRRINGFTFVKNEYLLDFPADRDPKLLPPVLAEHAALSLGVEQAGDARAGMRAMTLEALRRGDDGDALEELIAAVVLSSVVETDSDYGMSSGVRDLYSVAGAEIADTDGILELKKADFFCCCLPHPDRMRDVGDEAIPIVWRAAQRMMYNRWHFIPGELSREQIPEKRHYFFPPQVPDIAEHSDHRHGGHVASRVKFTIRAPGAQVWHPPFHLFGNGFRGCYDIRLVRMEGPPYTLKELREAVRHCSLVDEFWRTLGALAEKAPDAVPAIRGFNRLWYEERGWELMSPYKSTVPRVV